MRRFIIYLITFYCMNICLHAQTITLKEAEQLLLKQNLELIAEHYNIDIAQANVIQAKLFENPVVSLEQNVYNRLNGKYFDFGKDGESAIGIEQVISIVGKRKNNINLEKENKKIAEYQFEEVMRTLHGELYKRFIDIYFISKNQSVYDKEILSLDKLLAVMQEQQKKGNISLFETSRIEAMLLSLKREKNELENDETLARGELNILLHIPADKKVQLILDENILQQIDLKEIPYTKLLNKLAERPDLKIASSQVQASKMNIKLQKSMAYPEVSITGNYDRAGNFINNYFAVGLKLSIPIFNRNQGNIKSARIILQQANIGKDIATERAETEVFTMYSKLEKALKLYRSTDQNFEQNFGKLIDGVNENFTKRNISLLEFIDYYESYKDMYIKLCETRKDVFSAMENLNTTIGQNIFNY